MEAAPFSPPTPPLHSTALGPDTGLSEAPLLPVQNPIALLRIESMVRHIGNEVGTHDIDEAGAVRLSSLHRQVIDDLDTVLSPALMDELRRLVPPADESNPGEVAIVQAQLTGWLQGALQTVKSQAITSALRSGAQQAEPAPGAETAPSADEPPHGRNGRNRKRRHDAAYL